MLDVMMMSKNAIEAYNSKLRATAANIANMEVIGYKRLDISFQSVFEKVLKSGTPASPITEAGGTNPLQLGTGAALGSAAIDFSQGEIVDSSNNLAIAVMGNGLFMVSPDGGETMLYTRNGDFQIVGGNLLTRIGGLQVYGLNAGGTLTPITGLGTGSSLSWTSDGRLAQFNDALNWSESFGVTATGYRIAMTSFNNPSGLQQTSGTNFAETVSSGPALAASTDGGAYGSTAPRQLEKSNVFLTSETVDSMAAQQALNGNLAILRAINEEIANFINRLG